ncbi:MAG TPA: hypothetical protein DGG95_04570, partial [Cytophagales bacterium]|nr:hypothetical protein [Cytophagales bacterium]
AGVGTGAGTNAMIDFYSRFNQSTVGLTHNSHNQYLQTWMESGIVGLIAFLFCLFGFLLLKIKVPPSYLAFIIIFSLMCLTESIGERQKGVVFFTLFQSLFLGFEARPK